MSGKRPASSTGSSTATMAGDSKDLAPAKLLAIKTEKMKQMASQILTGISPGDTEMRKNLVFGNLSKSFDSSNVIKKRKLNGDDEFFLRLSNVKKVKCVCPSLQQMHISSLLLYLNDPQKYENDDVFLATLASCGMPCRSKNYMQHQIHAWGKILGKRKVNGTDVLCMQSSKKIILPQEKYKQIIHEAHLGIGNFIWSTTSRDERGIAIHNSFAKTLNLIETDYGVGSQEFGMPKYLIYEGVADCAECTNKVKKLPPLTKVLPTLTYKSQEKEIIHPDPDVLNESNSIDLSDAPVTMLWSKPQSGSVWYDQKGLAAEKDQFAKLNGVIRELSMELGAVAQGDPIAKDVFMTKLYCVERLVNEQKEQVASRSSENLCAAALDPKFLADFMQLQSAYIDQGRLDLFLYDVNLLTLKYSFLSRHETFLAVINSTMKKLAEQNQKKNLPEVKKTETTETKKFVSLTDLIAAQKLACSSPNVVQIDLSENKNTVSTVSSSMKPSNVITFQHCEENEEARKISQSSGTPMQWDASANPLRFTPVTVVNIAGSMTSKASTPHNVVNVSKISQTSSDNVGKITKISQTSLANVGKVTKILQTSSDNAAKITKIPQTSLANVGKVTKVLQTSSDNVGKVTKILQTSSDNDAKITKIPQTSLANVGKVTKILQTSFDNAAKITKIPQTSLANIGKVTKILQTSSDNVGKITKISQTSSNNVGKITKISEAAFKSVADSSIISGVKYDNGDRLVSTTTGVNDIYSTVVSRNNTSEVSDITEMCENPTTDISKISGASLNNLSEANATIEKSNSVVTLSNEKNVPGILTHSKIKLNVSPQNSTNISPISGNISSLSQCNVSDGSVKLSSSDVADTKKEIADNRKMDSIFVQSCRLALSDGSNVLNKLHAKRGGVPDGSNVLDTSETHVSDGSMKLSSSDVAGTKTKIADSRKMDSNFVQSCRLALSDGSKMLNKLHAKGSGVSDGSNVLDTQCFKDQKLHHCSNPESSKGDVLHQNSDTAATGSESNALSNEAEKKSSCEQKIESDDMKNIKDPSNKLIIFNMEMVKKISGIMKQQLLDKED